MTSTMNKDVTFQLDGIPGGYPDTPEKNKHMQHGARSAPSMSFIAVLFLIPMVISIVSIGLVAGLWVKVADLESQVASLKGTDATRVVVSTSAQHPNGYSGVTTSLLTGSGEWSVGAPMATERSDLQSIYCSGKIVLMGGMSLSNVILDIVTTFDPINEVYSAPLKPMPTPRYRFGAACLNGQIYVGGGFENATAGNVGWSLKTVDIYNIASDSWSAGPALGVARGDLTLAAANGKLYAIGGYDWNYNTMDTNEVLDLAVGAWALASPMPAPRGDIQAVVHDGLIYVPGGWNPESTFLNELIVYDPTTDQWSSRAPMKDARGDKAVVLLDGNIFVIGGEQWSGKTSTCDYGWGPEECAVNLIPMHSVEMYSPLEDRWTSVAPLPASRFRFAAAAASGRVGEGAIFAFGGHEHGEVAVKTQWTFHHVPQPPIYFHTV